MYLHFDYNFHEITYYAYDNHRGVESKNMFDVIKKTALKLKTFQ